MSNSRLRVAIAGAGIGGLALARGLHAQGHDVVVLEQAESLRRSGAAIGIWFNGMAALDQLGVSMDGMGRHIDLLRVTRSNGKTICAVDAGKLADKFGVHGITIARRTLVDTLRAGLPDDAVQFEQSVQGVTQCGDQVFVQCQRDTFTADLVIGADGYRSKVRESAFDPEPARMTGWAAWQGLTAVPLSLVGGTESLYILGRKEICGLMPAGDGLLQWWFDVRWQDGTPRPASVLTDLKDRFGQWASPVRDLFEYISEDQIEFWPYVLHRVLRPFSAGRVVLMGDALHAVPPSMAQGANQTLEDAWVLTRELGRCSDFAEAFRNYERARRRRIAFVSRMTPKMQGPGLYQPWMTLGTFPSWIGTKYWGALIKGVSNSLR